MNDCFTALGRHQMVEGREGDQRPLEEGLSKEREARRGGRAGMWPRRWHATEGRAENVTALCAYWRNGR